MISLKRNRHDPPDDRRLLPAPTERFRRRAWREFQRMLDPLAPPKRLPTR